MQIQSIPVFACRLSKMAGSFVRSSLKSSTVAVLGVLMLLTLPQTVAAAAEGFDCDPEPTTDQVFGYGDILTGGNCTISPASDVDIFQFPGQAGEQVRIILTLTAGNSSDPCVELRDPSNNVIVPLTCEAAVIQLDETLAASGLHKIIVTEAGNNNTFNYNMSLERLFPFRSPTVVAFGQVLTDEMISPASDLDTYSFNANVGDEVRIILTLTAGNSSDPCVELRDPSNVEVFPLTCAPSVIQLDTTIAQSGIHQLIVTEAGNNNGFNHTVSLQCISGSCAEVPLYCDVELSFADSTLTLDFGLATPAPASWRIGLVSLVGGVDLFATGIPVVDPPETFSGSIPGFPSIGKIVVWSSLATLGGITCFDSDTIDTGPLVTGSDAPTAEQLRGLVRKGFKPKP